MALTSFPHLFFAGEKITKFALESLVEYCRSADFSFAAFLDQLSGIFLLPKPLLWS
jgi:hypothetical protein